MMCVLGKVIDMTWRTIRIQTAYGNIVCIPNSVASESTLTNYNYPDDSYYHGFVCNKSAIFPWGEHRQALCLRDSE